MYFTAHFMLENYVQIIVFCGTQPLIFEEVRRIITVKGDFIL